jgi:hypothetical protein
VRDPSSRFPAGLIDVGGGLRYVQIRCTRDAAQRFFESQQFLGLLLGFLLRTFDLSQLDPELLNLHHHRLSPSRDRFRRGWTAVRRDAPLFDALPAESHAREPHRLALVHRISHRALTAGPFLGGLADFLKQAAAPLTTAGG